MYNEGTCAQFDAFKAQPCDTRIEMLNMIRLCDRAVFDDRGDFQSA